MARRRTFSAEFKREAVGLVRSSGQSTSRVARDLGINSSVLTPVGSGDPGRGLQGVSRPRQGA